MVRESADEWILDIVLDLDTARELGLAKAPGIAPDLEIDLALDTARGVLLDRAFKEVDGVRGLVVVFRDEVRDGNCSGVSRAAMNSEAVGRGGVLVADIDKDRCEAWEADAERKCALCSRWNLCISFSNRAS